MFDRIKLVGCRLNSLFRNNVTQIFETQVTEETLVAVLTSILEFLEDSLQILEVLINSGTSDKNIVEVD